MKTFNKHWLGIGLAAVVACSQAPSLPAQTDDQLEVQATNVVAADTNSVGDISQDSPATTEPPARPLRRGPTIAMWGNASSTSGETTDAVVAIVGSAKASGRVQDAVVAIGGDAEAEGDVGDAVVAVGGNATARGKVRDAVVAIAGDATVYGEVGDAVVAVMGNVNIGTNAVVNGDVVSVGGRVNIGEGAQVKGQIVEVSIAKYPILAPLQGVADWLRDCAFKFRLLAPHPGWYWVFVGVILLLYLLIAAAIPRPVAACLNELQHRPATTFLLGLLTKLLIPLVYLVLAITGIGMVVIPFIMAALFIGVIIGKVALFEWLGGGILNLFGVKIARPVLALLVGFALITLVYMVPFLSLLVYTLLGLWGLGIAVTATFSSVRKETPPRPPYVTPNPPMPQAPPGASGFAPAPMTHFAPGSENPGSGTDSQFNPPPPPASAPAAEAYALPRAGFWERMSAAFLDLIIVAILSAVVGGLPLGLLVALGYFAGMWAWKGTTIGGIVLNLKVARLDRQPVSFAVAFVRGLAASFSIIVFFVGFLWMLFDPDKQTWHDKIAGTVVVRVPHGMSLLCL